MMPDQLREDLESLLAEQDIGWCAYKDTTNMKSGTAVQTGQGGCLVQQMNRLLDGVHDTNERRTRKHKMVVALGFSKEVNGETLPGLRDMYEWNDAQRDPDAIKHRIKDALNNG